MTTLATLQERVHSLGGIRIDTLEQDELIEIFSRAIAKREKTLVLNHNLHSLYVHETMPAFREFYKQADWVYIDGMPVVWLAQSVGIPAKPVHRITLLDCFENVLELAGERGWRIFYLGGTEEVLSTGLTYLRAKYPRLLIAGRNGYFSDAEHKGVIQEINAYRPDVLFVGMGMPLQEKWLDRAYSELDAPVTVTCGATLGYVTGHSYKPPVWASTLGLYGIMRLFSEPRRPMAALLTRTYLPIALPWAKTFPSAL